MKKKLLESSVDKEQVDATNEFGPDFIGRKQNCNKSV